MVIDLRSVFFVITANNILITFFLFCNWWGNKSFFKGLINWALAFTLITIGSTLVIFRDYIHDLFSIVFPNILILSAYVLILDGISRFRKKKLKLYPEYILITAVAVLFLIYTHIQPNLSARIYIIQIAKLIVVIRIVYQLTNNVPDELQKTYIMAAVIFSINGFIYIFRFLLSVVQDPGNNYFTSGNLLTLSLIFMSTMILAEAIALIMLVNKRYSVLQNNSISQKELLIKETHHRIKNNFASIGGLLNLQAHSVTNSEAKSALQDAIGRVDSMQMLYEKLLLTDDYQVTSVKNYIDSLIDDIISIFPENLKLTVKKQITDFQLDSKRLFPIGIIVNELLTNTMKYAFIGKNSGIIQLILQEEKGDAVLSIQDDGNGLPEGFDLEEQKGFGLMLVDLYSQQLDGSFSIESNDGTKSILKFTI